VDPGGPIWRRSRPVHGIRPRHSGTSARQVAEAAKAMRKGSSVPKEGVGFKARISSARTAMTAPIARQPSRLSRAFSADPDRRVTHDTSSRVRPVCMAVEVTSTDRRDAPSGTSQHGEDRELLGTFPGTDLGAGRATANREPRIEGRIHQRSRDGGRHCAQNCAHRVPVGEW
jgi:hypothetical protein